jgi:hypothetical protein
VCGGADPARQHGIEERQRDGGTHATQHGPSGEEAVAHGWTLWASQLSFIRHKKKRSALKKHPEKVRLDQ